MTEPDSKLNSNVPAKLLAPYNPQETEDRIYKKWLDSGFFNPDTCIEKGVTAPDAPVFSMVLPPPNITGRLHLGHALEHGLQDTIIRFQRMRGKRTLWIPGTDHAAIATQSRFEKDLQTKEKKSRHNFSREEFFNMVHEFGLANQKEMRQQMRLLGSSLDWSREAFTLDEKRSYAVRYAFKQMYDEGLIYRGYRIVNWDPKGQTTISDDEIVYEERKAVLYTFKYSADFPIAISTTRPETKLGDTAVAVHPDDPRYTKYVGQTFAVDFCGASLNIRIIADKSVDKEFGTGALGVTPAHSMIDWDIAERHNLPKPQVIDERARMLVGNEQIKGTKTLEAREAVVQWLKEENLLIKEEETIQNISLAERTGGVVEPLPKLQWFISVNKPIPSRQNKSLKELMREPIESGEIAIVPEHFKKTYFNWIENLYDWCISRQIIYGHRIPVWYRKAANDTEETYCGIGAPEKSEHSEKAPAGNNWTQDTDTLDTWFSSGLWTFTTLGWPEKTKDLATYHPTSLMDPAYEILFFWVARMILMSQYFLGQVPFKTVLLHGVVRDKTGRKFSKSLKNGIEPEEVVAQFGSDALRMSMLVGNAPGSDINFDTQKVKAYKHFANKLWNISRFVLESTTSDEDLKEIPLSQLLPAEELLKKEFQAIIKEVAEDIEALRFHLASEKIYHYVWHVFADTIIEDSKKTKSISRKKLLLEILVDSLKLLHPFMPFVTEEIWGLLPAGIKKNNNLLIIQPWP